MKNTIFYKGALIVGTVMAMGTAVNAGSITGQIVCEYDEDTTDAGEKIVNLISIPGTSWVSTVDTEGYFNISGAPLGTHMIEVVGSPGWFIELGEVEVGRYATDMGVINICEEVPGG